MIPELEAEMRQLLPYRQLKDFTYKGIDFSESGKWEDDGEASYYVRILSAYGTGVTIGATDMDKWPADEDDEWTIFVQTNADGQGYYLNGHYVRSRMTLADAIEYVASHYKPKDWTKEETS